jgi:DNA-binding XRE family transcriptional regulator
VGRVEARLGVTEPEWASSPLISISRARECIRHGWGYVEDGGCWIAKGRVSSGYGPYLSFWLASTGRDAVPEGRELHHSCFRGNDGCVRPAHVEAVTPGRHSREHAHAPAIDRERWAVAIQTERRLRRWSKEAMARELGVTSNTIRNWERGKCGPSRLMQRIINQKFGWEIEPRKFVVTTVVQDVVIARTSGEAINLTLRRLPKGVGVRKTQVYDVRIVR